ncbi:calcineurin-like phosphoesterase [Achlya hypogyna]|uniref:Calcineurin-like phosphoesterase n=1 Tax=Achlya hypogyna TaxID=1202772 RepID=A0A1V9YXU6_ACHHY|nr:calcineurin-like phosphoesterase [Achlya hypogyna]
MYTIQPSEQQFVLVRDHDTKTLYLGDLARPSTKRKWLIAAGVGFLVVGGAVGATVALLQKKSPSPTGGSTDAVEIPSASSANDTTLPAVDGSDLLEKPSATTEVPLNPSSDPETAKAAFSMLAIGDWGSTTGKESGTNNNPGSCCVLYSDKVNPGEERFKVDFWSQKHVAMLLAKSAEELKPVRILGHGDNMYWNGVGSKDVTYRFTETFENVYNQPALKGIKWLNVAGNHDIGGSSFICGDKDNSFRECKDTAELLATLDERFDLQKKYESPDGKRWVMRDHYYVESFEKDGVSVDIFNIDTNHADSHGARQVCCQCFGYSGKLGLPSKTCDSVLAGDVRCAGGNAAMYKACMDKIEGWAQDSYTQAARDLKASTATFKIINTHYSPHYHMGEPKMKAWYKLCKDHGVNAWFNGHTHAFNHDIANWGTHFFENGGGGGIYTKSANGATTDYVKNQWMAGGFPYGFMELSFSADWLKVQFATFDQAWRFGGNNLDATVQGGLRRGHCWFLPNAKAAALGAKGVDMTMSPDDYLQEPTAVLDSSKPQTGNRKKKILLAVGGVVVVAVVATVIAVVVTKKGSSSTGSTTDGTADKSTSVPSSTSGGNDTIDTSLLPPKNETVDYTKFNPTSDPESMTPALTMLAIGDWGGTPDKVSGSDLNPGSCCVVYGTKTNPSEARYKVDFWAQNYVAAIMAQSAAQLKPVRILGHGDNFYWDGLGGTDKASRFANTFEAVYSDPALKNVKWVNVLGNHDIGGAAYLCGAETAEFKKCANADELLKNLRLRVKYQTEYTSPNSGRWLLKDHYYVESATAGDVTVDIFNIDTNYADNHGGMQVCCQCFGYGNDIPGFAHSKCEDAQPGRPECAGGDVGMYNACINEINSWGKDSIKQAARDIEASKADFKIINTHYSPHHHMSPDKQKELFKLTKEHNVQLFMNGHTHAFSHDTSSWGTHFIENGGGGGIYTKSGNALSNDYVKNVWVAGGNPYGFFELSFSKDWLKAQWVTFDKSWDFKGNNLEGTKKGGMARGHCWYIPSQSYTSKGAPGIECKSSINTPIGAPLG